MPFGESIENQSMPSQEKPENIEEREPITEKKIESAEEIKTPEKDESTEVEDNLKLEQIREELKKLQGEGVSSIVEDFQKKNHLELEDLKNEAKDKGSEDLKLRLEGEQAYSKEFVEKLDDILKHEFKVKGKDGQEESIVLRDIVDKHLKEFSSPKFSGLTTEKRAEKQREFVKDLGRGINKIPGGDPWSFYFKRIMETGEINCSGSTALAGMVLENTKEKTGIKSVEHGSPFGHAVSMITFEDGRLYFTDVRNGTFEDVSDYAKSEEKDGLKIYKLQSGEKTGYQIIPVSSIKEGAIGSYLSNLHSAYNTAEGKPDDALKMGLTEEELEEVQKIAKDVCQERGLSSPKQFHHLRDVKNFFSGKLGEYEESEEFKTEKKRIEKIIEKG